MKFGEHLDVILKYKSTMYQIGNSEQALLHFNIPLNYIVESTGIKKVNALVIGKEKLRK